MDVAIIMVIILCLGLWAFLPEEQVSKTVHGKRPNMRPAPQRIVQLPVGKNRPKLPANIRWPTDKD